MLKSPYQEEREPQRRDQSIELSQLAHVWARQPQAVIHVEASQQQRDAAEAKDCGCPVVAGPGQRSQRSWALEGIDSNVVLDPKASSP